MSIWTHVNGCLRLDGIPTLMDCSEKAVRKILGNTCKFDDKEEVWDNCTVPKGSEGSIQYSLAGNGLVVWTIPIWGDLRDFRHEDVHEIVKWFGRITKTKDMMIRSFILEVQTEGHKPKILKYKQPREVN